MKCYVRRVRERERGEDKGSNANQSLFKHNNFANTFTALVNRLNFHPYMLTIPSQLVFQLHYMHTNEYNAIIIFFLSFALS